MNEYHIFIDKLENSKDILDAINIIDNNLELLRYKEKNQRKSLIEKNLILKVKYAPEDELDPIFNDTFLLFEFNIDNLNKNDIRIISNSFYSKFFVIDLIDKEEKKLNNLSFGEQQLIFILNQLYFLRKKKYDELDLEVGLGMNIPVEYIVLLDEIDIGFHPDWQKRTIQYMIDFLKLMPDRKFHLIFTTHSPFLLSDIPKENIVFLNDKSSINQTFGANIHTLLSDSFFMEDGLMGEFAKGKINEIIDFFNAKNEIYKDKQDKLLKIINTIGEPFLKDKLLFMYNEKYPKTNEEKIIELQKQIESIKNGQDKI